MPTRIIERPSAACRTSTTQFQHQFYQLYFMFYISRLLLCHPPPSSRLDLASDCVSVLLGQPYIFIYRVYIQGSYIILPNQRLTLSIFLTILSVLMRHNTKGGRSPEVYSLRLYIIVTRSHFSSDN